MTVDNIQQNIEEPEGYKQRRGNRVPRKVESGINNLPGVADDVKEFHISDLLTDIGEEVPVEENLKPVPDKLKAVKRKNNNVSVDTIQPAQEGRLYGKQREIIKLRIGGTNSEAELRNVEANLPDNIKNNPYFRDLLEKQSQYLYGREKARRLDKKVNNESEEIVHNRQVKVDESSEPKYNANEHGEDDEMVKQKIELTAQNLADAAEKLEKLRALYTENIDLKKLKIERNKLRG